MKAADRRHGWQVKAMAATIAAVASLFLAAAAQAAVSTFTVSGFSDGTGSCSPPSGTSQSCTTLHAAEAAAEGVASPSNVPTIKLGAGAYRLSDGPLEINKAMTIQGAGMSGAPSGTTIEQTDGSDEVLEALTTTGTVTLQSLEITGGEYTNAAGGVYATGNLALSSVLVTGNTVTGGGPGSQAEGGGIYFYSPSSEASLTLTDSDASELGL